MSSSSGWKTAEVAFVCLVVAFIGMMLGHVFTSIAYGDVPTTPAMAKSRYDQLLAAENKRHDEAMGIKLPDSEVSK